MQEVFGERSFDDMPAALLREPTAGALDVDRTAAKTRACPKCGALYTYGHESCRACGLNFARHRMAQEMKANARPRYVALTKEEKKRGYTRAEVTAPPQLTSSTPWVIAAIGVVGLVAFLLWG